MKLKNVRNIVVMEALNNPALRKLIIQQFGGFIAGSEQATNLVLKSRQSRLETEASGPKRGFLFRSVKTLIEMMPGVLGPYGIGDVINFIEGVRGQELFGRKLDTIDRIISITAALIPVVPATPFRELARSIRINLEESMARIKGNQIRNLEG